MEMLGTLQQCPSLWPMLSGPRLNRCSFLKWTHVTCNSGACYYWIVRGVLESPHVIDPDCRPRLNRNLTQHKAGVLVVNRALSLCWYLEGSPIIWKDRSDEQSILRMVEETENLGDDHSDLLNSTLSLSFQSMLGIRLQSHHLVCLTPELTSSCSTTMHQYSRYSMCRQIVKVQRRMQNTLESLFCNDSACRENLAWPSYACFRGNWQIFPWESYLTGIRRVHPTTSRLPVFENAGVSLFIRQEYIDDLALNEKRHSMEDCAHKTLNSILSFVHFLFRIVLPAEREL